MQEKFSLVNSYLNSMHDQVVDSIGIEGDDLIFHYKTLRFFQEMNKSYYSKYHKFKTCDVIFKNVDVPYIEIKNKDRIKSKMRLYYMDEFLEKMKYKKYIIETQYFYTTYNSVLIEALLREKKGKKTYKCYFVIHSKEVIYSWK